MIQHYSLAEAMRDPDAKQEAVVEAAEEALGDFRVFVTQVMNFDGSIRGMPDYTDPGYDELFAIVPDLDQMDAVVEMPRECGKTILVSQLYPLWCGLRDPNDTILLVHGKHAVAKRWIATIKNWMLTGYREPDEPGIDLRPVFGPLGKLPPLGSTKWGLAEALDFPGRTVKYDETTVMCSGMDNIVTGGHWRLILADDLVNRENYRSPEMLRQVEEWWRLTPGLGRGRDKRRVLVGTRWNANDILGIVEDEQKALREKGEAQTKHLCILPARLPDGTPRFRHKDDAALKKDLVEMGVSIYAGQMDLKPLADGLQPLREEYFRDHFYKLEEVGHREGRKFVVEDDFHVAIFVDLAASVREGSDRTAIVVRASSPTGHIFVLDAAAGLWMPSEVFRRLTEWQWKYRAAYVGCEKGPLRAAYDGFLQEWNRDHRSRMLKLVDCTTGGGKNRTHNDRIMMLEPFAQSGMVHLLASQTELLYELCTYPNGKKNDLADACALAVHNPYRIRVKKRDAEVEQSECDRIMAQWKKRQTASMEEVA